MDYTHHPKCQGQQRSAQPIAGIVSQVLMQDPKLTRNQESVLILSRAIALSIIHKPKTTNFFISLNSLGWHWLIKFYTTKFISPAQTSLLKSRFIHVKHLLNTSTWKYSRHFKFNMSKTESVFLQNVIFSKHSASQLMGTPSIQFSGQNSESSSTPFFISHLHAIHQNILFAPYSKRDPTCDLLATATTFIDSHLNYYNSLPASTHAP